MPSRDQNPLVAPESEQAPQQMNNTKPQTIVICKYLHLCRSGRAID